MKTYRLLMILAALLLGNIILPAQEGNDYLQKIESSLSQSDCKKAQLWYKAYKNVTNKTDAGIEKRIAACEGKVNIPNPPPLHSSEPAMVYVQGGTFTMGCTSEQGNDCYDNEKPAHRVTLSDFYIGKYEVTQAQWQAVMGNNPSSFKGDNLPVENVSWDDAVSFCRELSRMTGKTYRLPTEAEWEYAARGGSKKTDAKYSGSYSPDKVAWYGDNSGNKTHPVGIKQANELGIYDMSGNVWEWCSDWYGIYPASAQTNPAGASEGSDRVFRGGSWSFSARSVRVPRRSYNSPVLRYYNLGFRLACSSNPENEK